MTIPLSILDVAGVRTGYREAGHGVPLLVLNGGDYRSFSSSHDWPPVLPLLAAAGAIRPRRCRPRSRGRRLVGARGDANSPGTNRNDNCSATNRDHPSRPTKYHVRHALSIHNGQPGSCSCAAVGP